MASAIMNKKMELEGNLKAFQLPDILRFLAMGRMTGRLSFSSGGRVVELVIKDGSLIGVGSTERFLKLGQMLVYAGRIGRKALDEVLEAVRESSRGQMTGEILIERNLASREEVEQALKLQIKEELWELFSWTDGSFKFEHATGKAMQRELVSLEIEPLIEEAAQQMEKWRQISGSLGNANEVFVVRPDLAAPPEARLTPGTWRVLSLINGRHSIQALVYLSGLGKFETLSALDRLMSLQIIEPIQRRARRPRAASDMQLMPAPPAAPAASGANATAVEASANETDGGLRGLLGLRRKSPRAAPRETDMGDGDEPTAIQVGPFPTSVGWACALMSRLAALLCLQPEFKIEAPPAALIESLWGEVSMRFPHADLIEPRDGQLDASLYERYVQLAGGLDPAMTGCHEDSMEALAAFGRALMRRANDRLDERAAPLIADTARPYLEGVKIGYPPDFSLRDWAGGWMTKF
jgi:hypothetical protein